ncbi:MAG: hypothetical protein EP343_03105 [Deltaproteobacteria bacterium]|nr:MAG: hypothetical protein EP343_03105 [Deltaproteobacteria bacterium]
MTNVLSSNTSNSRPGMQRLHSNTLLIAGVVMFLSMVWCLLPNQAHAQIKSEILLVTPQTTYTPGREVTAYVVFFRFPTPFGFFQRSWGQYIRGNRDFKLTRRDRISGAREEVTDSRGFPRERLTEVFRVRLRPKSSGSTLRYGPIQLRFREGFQNRNIVSNVLSFRRAKAVSKGSFQAKVEVPHMTLREGSSLNLKYNVKCPQTLCNFRRLEHNQLLVQFRDQVRLNTTQDFWVKKSAVLPRIRYLNNEKPPAIDVQFDYTVQPLRGGTLKTPTLRVPMPVLETIDQRPIIRTIRKWVQARGLSARDSVQLIQQNQTFVYTVNTKPVTIPGQTVQVQASQACGGNWQLTSKIVTTGSNNTKLWQVRLQGTGFLLQADRYLRETLEKVVVENNLSKDLELHHYRWQLTDQSLSGAMSLEVYFSFTNKPVEVPALSMQFLSKEGRSYTQSTKKLADNTPGSPLTDRLKPNKQERRIYISYTRPPTAKQSRPVDVWGYQLDDSFPLRTLLAQRWVLPPDFDLTPQTKMGQVTRRSVQMTPFGRSEQVYTQGIQMNVQVGRAHVRLKEGLFNKFPSVVWGHQRIHTHLVTSSDLTIEVKTDRDSYFVGEPVIYDIELHCPKSICSPQDKGFYAKFFNKDLTLPKFDKFSTWKKLENFKRIPSSQPGWVVLRTRIKFRAPSGNNIKLDGVRLRFSRITQIQLYRNHQICLFTNESLENKLKQSITKDHYNSQGQGSRCTVGTRELSTPELTIPIRTLPSSAKGIRLIGTFRIGAHLTQLTYPIKRTTSTDKPFYLLVTIEGDGDLQSARENIRDQLDNLAASFRKRGVTTYVELPDDKALRKQGKTQVQWQLIPEEPTTLTLPSLKLKYYHREEGILTAQTLPFTVKVTSRSGGVNPTPVTQRPAPRQTQENTTTLSETDLRPNQVLGTAGLHNQNFSLNEWYNLVLLLSPFGLFLFFLGWHRNQQRHAADPQRQARQKALRQFQASLRDIKPGQQDKWFRAALDALQSYLKERLSLSQKQLTASEMERLLEPHLSSDSQRAMLKDLLEQHQQLEASLYGGAGIDDASAFLKRFESHIRELDRALPRS